MPASELTKAAQFTHSKHGLIWFKSKSFCFSLHQLCWAKAQWYIPNETRFWMHQKCHQLEKLESPWASGSRHCRHSHSASHLRTKNLIYITSITFQLQKNNKRSLKFVKWCQHDHKLSKFLLRDTFGRTQTSHKANRASYIRQTHVLCVQYTFYIS